MTKEKTSTTHKVLTIVGTILCVILIPILIINVTLLAKSFIYKDEVPSIGGTLPLIVLTDSMHPVIESGDLIICHTEDAENIKVGDIIAFFDPAGNGTSIVTHKVIELTEKDGELAFVTKGDANTMEDRVTAKGDKLIGRYVKTLKGLTWLSRSMQKQGILVVFGLMLAGTAGIVITTLILKSKEEHQ